MAAVFPNGVVSFTNKRNLLDDVDAADINKMQDEIRALEETLGTLPTRVNLLEDEQVQDDQFEDQANLLFRNIGDRLAYIEGGKHIPAALLAIGRTNIPSYDFSRFAADKPNNVLDMTVNGPNPWNMGYDGGIKLPKEGFWSFDAHARYDMAGNSQGGLFNLAIDSNVDSWFWTRTYVREDTTNYPGLNALLSTSYSGWFSSGTIVKLITNQSSNRTQPLMEATLSAHWVRGF